MSNSEISLHTIPDIWADPLSQRPSIPFYRVLAIEDQENGITGSAEFRELLDFGELDMHRIDPSISPGVSLRLMDLFRAHFQDKISREDDNPTCHWLAEWMKGNSRPTHSQAIETATDIVKAGSATQRNLKIGEVGVFAVINGDIITPLHTTAGLDESKSLCVQFKTCGGPVAITRQPDLMAYYDALVKEYWAEDEYTEHGLYTAITAVGVR